MKRSKNYQFLWNSQSGYMQPRSVDGNWLPNFDPLELTEKGREVVEEVAVVRKCMYEVVYRGMTEQEKEVMQKAAKKMIQNMQEQIQQVGKENAE